VTIEILVYAMGWLTFAIVHSLLARLPVQRNIEPHLKGSYRLLYNGLSAIHILAVFALGRAILETSTFLALASPLAMAVFMIIKLSGFIIIVLSLTKYDLGRFSGLTQLRTLEYLSNDTQEPLQRSGLSQWVRHPLYSGVFLILWGGADSSFGFWTAVWGSLYLIVGTAFEERKLVHFYGDAYGSYQAEVPRYIPFKR